MNYPELIFLHPFMDILIRCGLICEQQRSRCAVYCKKSLLEIDDAVDALSIAKKAFWK